MRPRVFFPSALALLLGALVLLLTPLAYADPPDPTWVRGMWDDDDFDDVVGYVTSSTALVHTAIACEYLLGAAWDGLKPLLFDAFAASVSLRASSPRAPPTS